MDLDDRWQKDERIEELKARLRKYETQQTPGETVRVAGRDAEARAWDIEITRGAHRSTATIPAAEDPVTAIREAVAAREGVAPTALPPLADAIEPELLDILDEAEGPGHRLTFRYNGYRITVESDGTIHLVG